MILPIISAILGYLAFKFYPLGFIFLVPFFIFLLQEKKLKRLLIGSFLFKFVLFLTLFYFIFEPIIWFLSFLIFLGFPFLFFIIRKYLGKKIGLLSLPVLFVIFDFLQAKYTILPTYLASAGNTLGSSPFLGLASMGGLLSLSIFVVLVNILIVATVLQFLGSQTSRRYLILGSSTSLILILVFSGILISQSQLQKNKIAYQKLPKKLKIAVLSNKKEFDKDFDIFESDFLSLQQRKTAQKLINQKLNPIKKEILQNKSFKIDLLIFPEDMIDIESWSDADLQAKTKFNIENAGVLIKAYRNLAKELNVYLLATLTTIQNKKRYNSAILFSPQGKIVDIYHKTHLTIGSEYYPFNWQPFYYKLVKEKLMKQGDLLALFDKRYRYQKGEVKIIKTKKFNFGSAICIEIHYPQQLRQLKRKGAQFICNPQNNCWLKLQGRDYLNMTTNLRKIESAQLKIPIIVSAREEKPKIILPYGKVASKDFSKDKDFALLFGEIRL